MINLLFWLVIGILALGAVISLMTVGHPRPPSTKEQAVATALLSYFMIVVLVLDHAT